MTRVVPLLLLALLLTGCATVDRRMSTAVCMEKGASSSECAMARIADDQQSNARTQNAAVGAVAGCVLTGPFCLLGVGPLLGGVIGHATTK